MSDANSDMDLEADCTNKPSKIIERKLKFNERTRDWDWSQPKIIPSKKARNEEDLAVIKQLLRAKDLRENIDTFPKPFGFKKEVEEPDKTENGIFGVESEDSDFDLENDDDCFIYDDEDTEPVDPTDSHNFMALREFGAELRLQQRACAACNNSPPMTIKKEFNETIKVENEANSNTALQTPRSSKSGAKDESQETNFDSGISSTCSIRTHSSSAKFSIIFWEAPKVKVGNLYLVPGKNDCRWVRARLVDVCKKLYSFISLRQDCKIVVEEHNIAYPDPPTDPIGIGSRVVALANRPAQTGEMTLGKRPHRKGVVAEFPEARNKNRYLIIFEDGAWCHVRPDAVWPLNCQTLKVWQFLPSSSEIIVRNYLTGLYQPLTRYKRGDHVRYDGGSEFGMVLNVDSSLVIIHFPTYNQILITHRGSKRCKKAD